MLTFLRKLFGRHHTVDEISSVFHSLVAKLEAVIEHQEEKHATLKAVIEDAEKGIAFAEAEIEKAKAFSAKVVSFIEG